MPGARYRVRTCDPYRVKVDDLAEEWLKNLICGCSTNLALPFYQKGFRGREKFVRLLARVNGSTICLTPTRLCSCRSGKPTRFSRPSKVSASTRWNSSSRIV